MALDREPADFDAKKDRRTSKWTQENPIGKKGVQPPLKQPKAFAAHMV